MKKFQNLLQPGRSSFIYVFLNFQIHVQEFYEGKDNVTAAFSYMNLGFTLLSKFNRNCSGTEDF